MYSTSNQIRLASAALAIAFGLGYVATTGGAWSSERSYPGVQVQLEPVVIKASAERMAVSCTDTKAAL